MNEWLNHPHEYQGFLTSSTVEEEAPKFMQSSFYHGELANTMVLAVSNALEIPIVVFSSVVTTVTVGTVGTIVTVLTAIATIVDNDVMY